MSEIILSNDLNIITAEINSYKQMAGQSIFEIGKRLKHVKENDLSHGEFGKWLESIDINHRVAQQMMKVFEELPNTRTSSHLGLDALYLISTLAEEQRDEPHTIPSTGQTKTVDEMTVRELREVKQALKQAEERLQEEQNKMPNEVIKEVIPEHIKTRLYELEKKAGELESYKSEVNYYQTKKRNIENEMAQLLEQARKIKESNNIKAQQAYLINTIAGSVRILEQKKAEIQQALRKNIPLDDYSKKTLMLKSDFLIELANEIYDYAEQKNKEVVIIEQ